MVQADSTWEYTKKGQLVSSNHAYYLFFPEEEADQLRERLWEFISMEKMIASLGVQRAKEHVQWVVEEMLSSYTKTERDELAQKYLNVSLFIVGIPFRLNIYRTFI